MAYKRLCDICGKVIDEVYFDPRRIEYKRRIFGFYEAVDICQECAEEMEKYIKERRNDGICEKDETICDDKEMCKYAQRY